MALNDEEKAWVKEQWIAGQSAGQIARELSQNRPPVTRNAIVGVVSRAGLQRGPGSQVIRIPRPQLARSPKPPPGPFPEAAEVKGDPAFAVTLLAAEKGHCRFPVELPDDPGFFYCGRARQPGSPFCPGHFAIATQPKKERRP